MKRCALCGNKVSIDKYFNRQSTCPHCKGDLHICLNCRFYSETSHNKCLEPKAEFQRVRDKANFCDFFYYGYSGGSDASGVSGGSKEDIKKKFDDLFKKP